jgi:hypothetical protein
VYLRRRLRQLAQETEHLRVQLPKDSPYQSVLRLTDIARYIGIELNTLVRCGVIAVPRPMTKTEQLGLSRFFHGWDTGALVKAKVHDEWRILNPHSCDAPLAQMAATTGPAPHARSIRLKIDVTTLGPRLRGA